MRRFSLPLVILGCIALAALLTWLAVSSGTFKRGKGDSAGSREAAVTQTLQPFNRIEVAGAAEIVLVQGDTHSVAITPGSRKAGAVDAEVRDGTLYIASEDPGRWWHFIIGRSGNRPAHVVVNFADLREIEAAGTVKLSAATLRVNDLKVDGAGGTSVRIDDLVAQDLTLAGAGALRADLSGRVVNQDITISGAGDYRGARLASQNATVSVNGAGKVVLNVEKTLKATISGAGSVEYIGDPAVTERVSGAGRVKRREAVGRST
jgi:hypothetical protein